MRAIIAIILLKQVCWLCPSFPLTS